MKVAPVGNPAHRKRTYVKNRRATVKDEFDLERTDEVLRRHSPLRSGRPLIDDVHKSVTLMPGRRDQTVRLGAASRYHAVHEVHEYTVLGEYSGRDGFDGFYRTTENADDYFWGESTLKDALGAQAIDGDVDLGSVRGTDEVGADW
jgi:hypothetical protein